MTREEAIKWLEETIQDTDTYWESCSAALQKELDEQKEVFLLALSALRPVSREQVEKVWSPCNFCAGAKYITGGVTAVYPVSETRQQETLAEGDFDFCPVCGRPLTGEAVDMVMERLEAIE